LNISIIIIIVATNTVSIVHGIQIQMVNYIIIIIRASTASDVRTIRTLSTSLHLLCN
jgi:hypothetical protein